MAAGTDTSICLIVNPSAGRGKVWKAVPRIASALERLGVSPSCKISRGPHDAEAQAGAAAANGADTVAAIGGDGTVHHVANGLVGSDAALGVIPMGTGDDFAGHFGIPTDIAEACDVLLNGRRIRIDAARVADTYFFTVAHVGLDAEVLRAAGRIRKSGVTYTCLAVKTILRYRCKRVSLRSDGMDYDGETLLIAIGNTSRYGRGMKVTPAARADDGMLDICLGEGMHKLEVFGLFPRIFSGRHVSHKKVRSFRAKRVSLRSETEMELYGDGELLARLPVDIEVVPSALWMMAPR